MSGIDNRTLTIPSTYRKLSSCTANLVHSLLRRVYTDAHKQTPLNAKIRRSTRTADFLYSILINRLKGVPTAEVTQSVNIQNSELEAAHSRKKRSQQPTVTATYQITTFFNPAVSPPSVNPKHFQRRNLKRHIAAGGIVSGDPPQKAVTATHRDRHIFKLSLSLPPAVSPPSANLKHFQRRNLKRLTAAKSGHSNPP